MTTTTPAPTRNGAAAGASTAPARPAMAVEPARTEPPYLRYLWAATRLSIGWIFLWAFVDKLFGLGHETPSAGSWLNGGNPTKGFLSGATGPFAGIYHDIAGAGIVNVLFMGGLLGIGLALMLGIAMWPASIAGATMLVLMWSAALPSANNLFMDEHIIYALVLIGLASIGAGRTLGLGDRWAKTEIAKRYAWLA
jgi:thiosulfate dehydrogenase (quinone) large subunit